MNQMKNQAKSYNLTKNGLFFLFLVITACNSGQSNEAKVFQVSDQRNLTNIPVSVDMETGTIDENASLCLNSESGSVPGQIERLSDSQQRLWWLANQEANETKTYTLSYNEQCAGTYFSWKKINDEATRLVLDEHPVIQYEHPVFDRDNIEDTEKPFHQVYHPNGIQLLTKGIGGRHEHHRGIFFGYDRVYDVDRDVGSNIWYPRSGERSEHEEVIKEFTGPVMGGHVLKIYWKNRNGEPFIEETREIRVFQQSEGESLIDFHSTLKTLSGTVHLNGDRHHAGLQFRASQYVADNLEDTKFIRPEQWSHLEPNDEIEEADMMDLPWNAMQFKVENQLATVAYLSHPSNPENAEMSERLYGRFGEFFPHSLTVENPLKINYRFWVTTDQNITASDIDLRYNAYATPAVVRISK